MKEHIKPCTCNTCYSARDAEIARVRASFETILDKADGAFPVEDNVISKFGHKLIAEIKKELNQTS